MMWEQWISLAALVIAAAAVVVGVAILRRIGSQAAAGRPLRSVPAEPSHDGPPAFVVNPIKVSSMASFRDIAGRAATQAGLPEPIWFTTSPQETGAPQAQAAVEAGASVVVAVGGDGTVRAVATGLAQSGVPMGLVPMGTGNLLARNLDLPVNGTQQLIHTALTGTGHAIDLGWVRPIGPMEAGDHAFLVMSGVGFDAAMVAGADDELKSRLGWLAYFVVGAKHLHGRKVKIRVQVDDDSIHSRKLRSLLVANVGRLPGGFVLFPDADADDGSLDVAALDTRGGLIGWASLFGTVVMQGIGIGKTLPRVASNIEFWRGQTVSIYLEDPEPLQVDGDLIGDVSGAEFRLDVGALLVRTQRR